MNIQVYMQNIDDPGKRNAYEKLWNTIEQSIPVGFVYDFAYNIPGFSVPKSIYPPGYYVDPKIPLPFIGLASQKNYISLYHMGLYAEPILMEWFLAQWPEEIYGKPDMGKSCIRFKRIERIPFELVGNLAGRLSVDDYIKIYEQKILKKKG
jgi:hypothetical protein